MMNRLSGIARELREIMNMLPDIHDGRVYDRVAAKLQALYEVLDGAELIIDDQTNTSPLATKSDPFNHLP